MPCGTVCHSRPSVQVQIDMLRLGMACLHPVRTPEGTFTFANGDLFEGSMVANRMQGSGQMRYRNGNQYRGEFKEGHVTGPGTMTYRDGAR
jgi:hypothetical protein